METALDCGIKEYEFWEMTFAEVTRAIKSYNRLQERQAQERASFDYILADLIGRSIARTQHSSNKMPDITEAYPSLFNTEAIQEQRRQAQAELSVARFKQFADFHNKRFKEVSESSE